MKLEKINDNQIRCTLTSDDLADRELKLSELAYGTEKARDLFRDMMQQAQIELGFEANNVPLMIEAVPMAPDGIMLIITKVDDPEELDTRFSRFTAAEDFPDIPEKPQFSGADDILDIFKKLVESKNKAAEEQTSEKPAQSKRDAASSAPVELIRVFTFDSLDTVIESAHGLNNYFNGYNSLYKHPQSRNYQLVIRQSGVTPEEFNKVCNILSEYGKGASFSSAAEAYLMEHGEVICREQALQQFILL